MPKWLKELIIVIIVVLFIRAFLLQAYNIPSGSMKPTLLVGDFILVNKLVYRLSDPQRGDIVVFKWPVNPEIDFIKRIVGMPGDTIEIRGEKVFINGQEVSKRFVERVQEDSVAKLIYEETLPNGVKHKIALYEDYLFPRKDVPYIKIPEGHYFVMGDNRDNSEDSRYWGLLPRENIVGKAFVIYFSGDIPPLETTNVSIITGFKQLFLAFLKPRLERIGYPIIW
ncbi:MAG: signal peptidase I [Aquificaceae bacterium]|nr:signal peptidase I [Aquificaceae bacterium]MCS7195726.1 signal peptidase I [Aquificaceae bacterium]MCX7989916.1 signal peptidase I [Aquificaceae bacterium]MDW8032430.1 signal peptidase I [Aquificaceae bacterium]MDW8294680.1 signal peptidase I [Aquificaceae bacterium]